MLLKALLLSSAVASGMASSLTQPLHPEGPASLQRMHRHLLVGNVNTEVDSTIETNTGQQASRNGDVATHNGDKRGHSGDTTTTDTETTSTDIDHEEEHGHTTSVGGNGRVQTVHGSKKEKGWDLGGATLFKVGGGEESVFD